MAKINLPKRIKVGGVTYTVIYSTFPVNSEIDGFHSYNELLIKVNINKQYNLQYILYNFLHEIFHAIDAVYMNKVFTEHSIFLLSKAWYHFIFYNNFTFNNYSLPKFLYIFTTLYKITYSDKLGTYDLHLNDIEFSFSEAELRVSTISNDTKFSKEILQVNLIEAIILGMIKEYNFSNHEDFEDINTTILSNGIYQVFKDNELDIVIRSALKQ